MSLAHPQGSIIDRPQASIETPWTMSSLWTHQEQSLACLVTPSIRLGAHAGLLISISPEAIRSLWRESRCCCGALTSNCAYLAQERVWSLLEYSGYVLVWMVRETFSIFLGGAVHSTLSDIPSGIRQGPL